MVSSPSITVNAIAIKSVDKVDIIKTHAVRVCVLRGGVIIRKYNVLLVIIRLNYLL